MTAQIAKQRQAIDSAPKTARSIDFFYLGLLCFLALGSEMLVIVIDHTLWGDLMTNSWSKDPWFIIITHWLITISIWGISAFGIFSAVQKKTQLENVLSLKRPADYLKKLSIAIGIMLLLTAVEPLIEGSSFSLIPQFLRETSKFVNYHGLGLGLIIGSVQIIYYIVEAVLVLLLLVTMQRAGELCFNTNLIPFGGIALMFTWGLAHLTKGLPAVLWLAVFTISAGMIFTKNKKSIWIIYPFILSMFLI